MRKATEASDWPQSHQTRFHTRFHEWLRGMLAALPVAVGFVPLAFILGAEGSRQGLSSLGMGLMSGLNYAGGSEFAALALWSAAPPVFVVMMTTWLVNSRHILLGAALTPHVDRAGLKGFRALLVFFLMCDEAWALGMQDIEARRKAGLAPEVRFSPNFYFGSAVVLWITWFMSAALGAAAGGAIGDLDHWGFGMAFPAVFIALLSMMWPGRRKALPPLAAALVSAAASLWFPLHLCVLAGTLTGLAAAYLKEASSDAEDKVDEEAHSA